MSLAIARADENGDCSSRAFGGRNLGQLRCYGTPKRMSKVGHTPAIETECGHEMIVCCLRVQLCVRVSRRAAE